MSYFILFIQTKTKYTVDYSSTFYGTLRDTHSKSIIFKLKSKKVTLFFNIFVLKNGFYQQVLSFTGDIDLKNDAIPRVFSILNS